MGSRSIRPRQRSPAGACGALHILPRVWVAGAECREGYQTMDDTLANWPTTGKPFGRGDASPPRKPVGKPGVACGIGVASLSRSRGVVRSPRLAPRAGNRAIWGVDRPCGASGGTTCEHTERYRRGLLPSVPRVPNA